MANATLTSITALLKEMYEEPFQTQLQDEAILTQRIEKSSDGVVHKAGGKYVDFPVLVGRNQGISFRQEFETLGNPGRARWKEVNAPLYYGYVRGRVSGQVIELAKDNEQAFANAIDQEMEIAKESVRKDQNRIYYGTGDGRLATITVTANSATQSVDSSYWLEIDAEVDVMNAAGTKIGTALTVVSVDDTVTPNTVTLSASVNATASTHFIVRAGDYDTATQREPTGLGKITDNTVNLHGLNDPSWKSIVTNLGGSLSEAAMIALADKMRAKGSKPTAIFTSLGVRRAYFNLLVQQRRFNNTTEFGGGFVGLPFHYGSKEIPVMEDPDAPASTMFMIQEDMMRVYHTGDWHFEDKTGSMFVQVANTDAFDFWMKRYFELATRRRNAVSKMTNINEN